MRHRFGEFVLDNSQRQLLRDNKIALDLHFGEAWVLEVVQLAECNDTVQKSALVHRQSSFREHLLLPDLIVAREVDRVLQPFAHHNLQTTLVADLHISQECDNLVCGEQ